MQFLIKHKNHATIQEERLTGGRYWVMLPHHRFTEKHLVKTAVSFQKKQTNKKPLPILSWAQKNDFASKLFYIYTALPYNPLPV